MTYDWHTHLRSYDRTAATFLPPATVEETGWDILVVLHSNRGRDPSLRKLGSLVGVPEQAMIRWLATLERRGLITGAQDDATGQIVATLTQKGHDLLDRYFSATSDLQLSTHH